MKLGMIIYSNEPETVWNAFRMGVFALTQGDSVKAFLLAKGVECQALDTDRFKVTEQMKAFVEAGGEVLACGTCLKIRQTEGSQMCPMSTMADLYGIIRDCDKVVSF